MLLKALKFILVLEMLAVGRKKLSSGIRNCVKRAMKERGYANAVVFDPDEMSDFKKKNL